MGTFAQWRARARDGAWTVDVLRAVPDNEELERWLEGARAPAVAAWVYDSDFGYAAAAEPSGRIAWQLLVNRGAARAYGVEIPAEVVRALPAAVARWAEAFVPRRATEDEVAELMAREFTFADEGVQELFELLGLELPSPVIDAGVDAAFDALPDDAKPLDGPRLYAHDVSPLGAHLCGVLLVRAPSGRSDIYFYLDTGDRGEAQGLEPDAFTAAEIELREVPDHVPRTLAATDAWVREALGLSAAPDDRQ